MKVLLMHADRDFNTETPMLAHEPHLRQDLALETLLSAMADGDEFVLQIARKALLTGIGNDEATIRFRQGILRDCLDQPQIARELYALAGATLEDKRKNYWGFIGSHPSSVLYSAKELLSMFVGRLRALRAIAEQYAGQIQSRGLRSLFATLKQELGEDYLARIEAHLIELKFPHGTLLSARLGEGAQSTGFDLRRTHVRGGNWLSRMLEHGPPEFMVRIANRDMIGAKTLGEMRDRGINEVANALAQASDHILAFFQALRAELAFYVGCLNLDQKLAARNVPRCLPQVRQDDASFRARDLRDACLALSMEGKTVGNTIDAHGKALVVITGANQGGKSTFLRSLGVAQLMMQSGMFVAAEAFSAPLCSGLFTHYKREEDAGMTAGKLDEELGRLSEIADVIRPGALLLCNESFASTNEREGSEVAHQVVHALRERGVRIAFVTHLYAFARGLFEEKRDDALFLRAERRQDGTRTFKLIEAAPLETSYGGDLYREIFESGKIADPAATVDASGALESATAGSNP